MIYGVVGHSYNDRRWQPIQGGCSWDVVTFELATDKQGRTNLWAGLFCIPYFPLVSRTSHECMVVRTSYTVALYVLKRQYCKNTGSLSRNLISQLRLHKKVFSPVYQCRSPIYNCIVSTSEPKNFLLWIICFGIKGIIDRGCSFNLNPWKVWGRDPLVGVVFFGCSF